MAKVSNLELERLIQQLLLLQEYTLVAQVLHEVDHVEFSLDALLSIVQHTIQAITTLEVATLFELA